MSSCDVSDPTDHVVFFDNLFSSYDLFVPLNNKGIRATGTLRESRLRKCPIPPAKELKKQERGWLKYAYKETNKIFIAKWKDNSIVTLGTNYDTVDPLDSVKRWCKDMKKNIDTQRLQLCAAYVQEMGGVDSLDQGINAYRIGIRRKKWWWVLFTLMLNTLMVNAWRLHLLANQEDPIDLLSFVRYVTCHYLRVQEGDAQRAATSAAVPQSIKEEPWRHFPQKLPNRLRCCHCHKQTRWSCKKCKVILCTEKDCFKVYHQLK